MILEKSELKIYKYFYLQSLVLNITKVVMPFYILFFLGIGFNFFQIAMIGTIRSIVSIFLEIPTGAIADIYSRKISVVTGYTLMGITLILVFTTSNFYLLLLIFAVNAGAETLVSGAESAWAVDLAKRDDTLSDKYFLKKRVFRNIGLVIAPIIASATVKYFGMSPLWVIHGLGVFVSGLLLLGATSPMVLDDSEDEDEYEATAFKDVFLHSQKTFNFIRKHKVVSLIILASFIFFFVEEITSLVWTPLLVNKGMGEEYIGYLFSVIALIGIVTPLITERILKKLHKFQIAIIASLIYAVFLMIATFIQPFLGLALFFVLTYSLEEILEPISDAIVNDFLDSKIRATALSLQSVIISFASIIGGPLAGYLLGYISLTLALFISGIIFVAIPFIYIIASKRSKNL